MILLKPCPFDKNLYYTALIDSPGKASSTNIFTNIVEAGTCLYSFEDAYNEICQSFERFGYSIQSSEDFLKWAKPFYQSLRHGLSFDWVINHFVGLLKSYFPFCAAKKFKGTDSFIQKHMADQTFSDELSHVQKLFDDFVEFVFEGSDPSALRRLSEDAGSEILLDCMQWLQENEKFEDYNISEQALIRTNYIVALVMMLSDGVGIIKRISWHKEFDDIESGSDSIIVSGGKFRALAYGNFDGEPKWKLFDEGLCYSSSGAPLDYKGTIPGLSTLIQILPTKILFDESFRPQISLNSDNFVTPEVFVNLQIYLDKPQKIKIKFNLLDIAGTVVECTAIKDCMFKDSTIVVGEDGIGETQIVFCGPNPEFEIGNTRGIVPANRFKNVAVQAKIDWLN